MARRAALLGGEMKVSSTSAGTVVELSLPVARDPT
jgi:signal transduction histidine kinase